MRCWGNGQSPDELGRALGGADQKNAAEINREFRDFSGISCAGREGNKRPALTQDIVAAATAVNKICDGGQSMNMHERLASLKTSVEKTSKAWEKGSPAAQDRRREKEAVMNKTAVLQAIGAVKGASAFVPRHYQTEAVEALWQALITESGNPLAVLPTGTGKAAVICLFVMRVLREYPKCRILVLTHSKELVKQNFEEQIRLWPECPAGINNAGLGKRDVTSPVVFGSIQSVHRSALEFQQVDIVLVDEAQSIPRDSDTMWLKFFSDVRKFNPHLRVCGLTATDYRMDSGKLSEGDDAMFSRVVYEYSILDAISSGYLCPPVSKSSATQIDTSQVGTRGGEFIAGELDAAASDPMVVEAIAEEICKAGQDRRGWIVFGAGIKNCELLKEAIQRRGFTAEGVYATTKKADRDTHIARFKKQQIRCLLSVNALAVGFNAPHVDLIGLARPTKSTGLYIQICGRGTRLFEGKSDCLVLDFGGNIGRHGYIDQPNIKTPIKGEGSMPEKTCPQCFEPNAIAARECVNCGFEFEIQGAKVAMKSVAAPLLSIQDNLPQWTVVKNVAYSVSAGRNGKPSTLKVTYQSGLNFISEWVCFDHQGYARTKAESWWKRRAGNDSALPASVAEAASRSVELRSPSAIMTRENGKFVDIINTRFE